MYVTRTNKKNPPKTEILAYVNFKGDSVNVLEADDFNELYSIHVQIDVEEPPGNWAFRLCLHDNQRDTSLNAIHFPN